MPFAALAVGSARLALKRQHVVVLMGRRPETGGRMSSTRTRVAAGAAAAALALGSLAPAAMAADAADVVGVPKIAASAAAKVPVIKIKLGGKAGGVRTLT